jgi:zinc transporter 5/7
MRGVFLHVMADTLGSVGVIISTLLIQFYGWTGFDPIASLFIAVLIAASVVPLVIDTGKVLALDVGDRDGEILSALDELRSIEEVASYASPRFWPKDSTSLVGSIHVQIRPQPSLLRGETPGRVPSSRIDRVVERVERLLKERIRGLEELTVQVEKAR